MQKYSVLIVEDNQELAASMGEYLSLEGFECDYDATGRLAYNLLEDNYEVIVLDLNLPYRDGLTICSKLRANNINTPILMLTARETLDNKLEGFAVGADDYLIKPFDMPELVARLKVLTQRHKRLNNIITVGDLTVDLSLHIVKRGNITIKLTPFCWKILEYLVKNSPRIISRQELEDYLWGNDSCCPAPNSLKVHIHKLRSAIDKPFTKPLIHTISGIGITIREHNEKADN
ncbi:response regulator transcription factor [Endozoicomonas sp. SM1973]|uniref:Response regulator transcription factor n=1 Tax=Spartinivicinus marinus TaxID=2994442 RepID=A0A853ICL8_9GAMM|nr:response regulator transcription factor [Spartinivicinus marinus]MCX4026388.1 response regulator transcription factor [Spartinivicinus marinus]NYZ67267.1 response regulator transcription factor [Spartinivicinus marinus]